MGKNATAMDRRSFLKGAFTAGAAATAVGAGALTGCASEPKGAAANDKMASTGTYSFETAPDPIPESDITSTVDADIVIIGAGFSGLV